MPGGAPSTDTGVMARVKPLSSQPCGAMAGISVLLLVLLGASQCQVGQGLSTIAASGHRVAATSTDTHIKDTLSALAANIPGGGVPGQDYPILASVPDTGFSCQDQQFPGYYADTADDAGCQVFHICHLDGRLDSFLCPNGTVFNQQYFVCDWWYNVDCSASNNFLSRKHDSGPVPRESKNDGHVTDIIVSGVSRSLQLPELSRAHNSSAAAHQVAGTYHPPSDLSPHRPVTDIKETLPDLSSHRPGTDTYETPADLSLQGPGTEIYQVPPDLSLQRLVTKIYETSPDKSLQRPVTDIYQTPHDLSLQRLVTEIDDIPPDVSFVTAPELYEYPDTAGSILLVSDLKQIPHELFPAYQTPQEPSTAYQTPQEQFQAYQTPKEPSSVHQTSHEPSSAYQDLFPAYQTPQEPSTAYQTPQEPSPAYQTPQEPSPSYQTPQEPSPAYQTPQEPSTAHQIPQEPSPAYQTPQEQFEAYQTPQEPFLAHQTLQENELLTNPLFRDSVLPLPRPYVLSRQPVLVQ